MATRAQQIGAWLAPLGVAACGAVGFGVFTIGLRGTVWLHSSRGVDPAALIWGIVVVAIWAAGAFASAGIASAAIGCLRLPTGALAPAFAWVASALAACPLLGWDVHPKEWRLSQTGPAVAVWLIVGVCVLVAPRRTAAGRLGGWWAVPARALVAWSLTYGALWGFLAAFVLAGMNQINSAVVGIGLLSLMVLGTGAVLAVAGAAIGPLEPGPQLFSAFIAAAGVPLCLPESTRQLTRAARRVVEGRWALDPLLDDLFPSAVIASFAAVAWVACAVLIWLRSRHRARSAAAQPPGA